MLNTTAMQALGELYSAARSGMRPLKYVGALLPPWHHALVLVHALAHSGAATGGRGALLLSEARADDALLAFVGACEARLRAAAAEEKAATVDQRVSAAPHAVSAFCRLVLTSRGRSGGGCIGVPIKTCLGHCGRGLPRF